MGNRHDVRGPGGAFTERAGMSVNQAHGAMHSMRLAGHDHIEAVAHDSGRGLQVRAVDNQGQVVRATRPS